MAKGHVVLEFSDGRVFETKNLLVNNFRVVVCNLVAGTNQNNYVISQVGLGSGNTQPDLTDTALVSEIVKVPIVSYSFPDFNIVEFSAYVDQNTANGYTIEELGLFTTDNTLVARTLVSPTPKDSTFSFYVLWRIQLT